MKLKQDGQCYYITSKKAFEGRKIENKILNLSLEFAYEMAFGEGHHRKKRSGGQELRNNIDVFNNTLQGKIAEYCLHKVLCQNGIKCKDVDVSVSGKGVWDDSDLSYNDLKINVKSMAFYSHLLLLETKDWDEKGLYIPNKSNNETTIKYDYFVAVRIKPNTNSIKYDSWKKDDLIENILSSNWYFDIGGWCSHKTLKYIIKNNYILPQNTLLNGKTKMDAENYYIQFGNLKHIDELVEILYQ
jgi:hypothetical protein